MQTIPSFTEKLKIYNKSKRKLLNNLNIKLLLNYEASGIEVVAYALESGLTGASIIDPLQRLLKKGSINQKEYSAAIKYISDLELAHKSHHARPNYEDPISSSNFSKERIIPQHQLNAAARVNQIRIAVEQASQPKQFKDFKNFKDSKRAYRNVSRDKRLLEVLETVFERGLTINAAEKHLHIGHRMLEEKIKEICEIMLEF